MMPTAAVSSIELLEREAAQTTAEGSSDEDDYINADSKETLVTIKPSAAAANATVVPAAQTQGVSGARRWALILMVMGIGCALVLAVSVNVELAKKVGGLRAAGLNYAVGSAVLLIVTIGEYIVQPSDRPRLGDIVRLIRTHADANIWMWFGGAVGAVYVSNTILMAPLIGLTLFFVSVVCGQLLSSLSLDTFGWIHVEKRPLYWSRVVGTVVVIAAVIVIQDLDDFHAKKALYCAISLVAGACLPIQASVNNYLSRFVLAPHRSACVSFIVGCFFTFAASFIRMIFVTQPFVPEDTEWWYWIGGAIGAVFVTSVIYVPRYIGVAVTFVSLIVGQVLASFMFDSLGLFDFEKKPVTTNRVVGVCLAVVGVIICQYRPNDGGGVR